MALKKLCQFVILASPRKNGYKTIIFGLAENMSPNSFLAGPSSKPSNGGIHKQCKVYTLLYVVSLMYNTIKWSKGQGIRRKLMRRRLKITKKGPHILWIPQSIPHFRETCSFG